MLWRRCPGLMPRGLRGWIAKRFATRLWALQCKGIGGASRPSKGLRAAAADGAGRQEAALARSSSPGGAERDGVCDWTRADLCRSGGALRQDLPFLEHDPGSTADGFSRHEGAPEPPANLQGRRSAGAPEKGASRHPEAATAAAHPDKRLQLWFQDEARVGAEAPGVSPVVAQGRACPRDASNRYQWAYIFSAVRPDTVSDVTLVMPSVTPRSWTGFSHTPIPWPDARRHDGGRRRLAMTSAPSPFPDNVTLACCRLTSRTNPVERVWLATRTLPIAPRPRDPRPSSTPVAKHGSTSSQNRIVANPLRLSMDHEGDFIGSTCRRAPPCRRRSA